MTYGLQAQVSAKSIALQDEVECLHLISSCVADFEKDIVRTVLACLRLLYTDFQVTRLLSAIQVSVAMLVLSRVLVALDYLAFVFFLM